MAEDELTVTTQAPPVDIQTKQPYNRLSMPDGVRIGYASLIATITGGMLGVIQSSRTEAFRFRAENAHRLPTTTKGWYLYHKSKNYAVMFQGIKGGFRMGRKLGFWVGLFFFSEMLIDRIWNDRKDFRSTMVTGVATAVAWSRFYSMTGFATRKIVTSGLKTGIAYGLLQDAIGILGEHMGESPSTSESQLGSSGKT